MRDNFVCYDKESDDFLIPKENEKQKENVEEGAIINKIVFEDTRSILKKVYLI